MKTGFRSKSIWLYIIGGLFIIFVLGSIYGKSSEATTTTDKEVKSSSINNAEPVKTENQSIATNTTKEVYC